MTLFQWGHEVTAATSKTHNHIDYTCDVSVREYSDDDDDEEDGDHHNKLWDNSLLHEYYMLANCAVFHTHPWWLVALF